MNELVAWPMDEKEYTASGLGAAYSARTRGILRGTDFPATASGNLTVTIGTGLGCLHVNDFWAIFPVCTTTQTLELTDSDGSLDRIDAIALRLDKNANIAGLEVVAGTPSKNPMLPPVQRGDDYDDIFLYQVYRSAGSTEITAADIKDLRLDARYCGLMKSELDCVDTSVLQSQIDSFISQNQSSFSQWRRSQEESFAGWSAGRKENFESWENSQKESYTAWSIAQRNAFETWANSLKELLESSDAGKLQLEIDEIKDSLIIIRLHFASEYLGAVYTLTGAGDQVYSGVVDKLVIEVPVKKLDSEYILRSAFEGADYEAQVHVGNYYGYYDVSLTVYKAYLHVKADSAGASVVAENKITVTDGTHTYTQTVQDENVFAIYYQGEYSVSMSNGTDQTATASVTVDGESGKHYHANVAYWRSTIEVTANVGTSGGQDNVITIQEKGTGSITRKPIGGNGTYAINVFRPGTYVISMSNSVNESAPVEVTVSDKSGALYRVSLTYLEIVSFSAGTDAQIASMIRAGQNGSIKLSDYWAVGQKRDLELLNGEVVSLVLMHKGGIQDADGWDCNFVIGMENCLEEARAMSQAEGISSWEESDMRAFCNEDFRNLIPETLRGCFRVMTIKTKESEAGTSYKESADYFALPDIEEIFGGGTLPQFEYYETPANRKKDKSYWTRSPQSSKTRNWISSYSYSTTSQVTETYSESAGCFPINNGPAGASQGGFVGYRGNIPYYDFYYTRTRTVPKTTTATASRTGTAAIKASFRLVDENGSLMTVKTDTYNAGAQSQSYDGKADAVATSGYVSSASVKGVTVFGII